MDKYIEIMAVYWIDWQQTAIDNTRYSVAVALLAVFIGGLVIAILKSGKIGRLIRQIKQGEQLLEQADKKHEELVAHQKNDQQQISGLQQQIEQASINLLQEREEHQSNTSSKEALFLQSVQEKQSKIDETNLVLTEKNQLVEQLQNELNEQKTKISQYAEMQAKFVEMEKQANQSAVELNEVKLLLEIELNNKIEHAKQIEVHEKTTQSQLDRISELELQLENESSVRKIEEIQQQQVKQEDENKQLEQENQNQLAKQQREIEQLEQEKQNKLAEQLREKEQLELARKNQLAEQLRVQQAEEKRLEQEKPELESKVEPEPETIIASVEKDVTVSVEQSAEKKNLVGGVLGWFSSFDKKFESEEVTENLAEKVEKEMPSKIKARPKVVVEMPEEEASFSEKLAEVADKMDSFQGKFKGYFNKSKS